MTVAAPERSEEGGEQAGLKANAIGFNITLQEVAVTSEELIPALT